MTLFQEMIGEVIKLGDFIVISICPEESLFEGLFAIVGKVFAVNAIGDDEDLHVLKESTLCPEGMTMVAVDLVERLLHLHTPPLEFDLHQWQAVNE